MSILTDNRPTSIAAPPASSTYRRVGATLFVIGLCLNVFSAHWRNIGFPPIDRPLLLAGMAWTWLGLDGVDPRRCFRWRGVHWLMLFAVAYAIISAIAAQTITDKDSVLALIDSFGVIPYIAFASAAIMFRTAAQRQVLIAGMTVLGLYLSVIAILEITGPHGLVVPHYIVSNSIVIHEGRARGPFTESVVNGAALFACAAAAAMAARMWPQRSRRIPALVVVGLCVAATFLTLTRSVWLATVAASLAAAAADRPLRRLVIPALLGVALSLVALLAFAPSLRHHSADRLNDQQSLWDRRNMDLSAARMFAAHPVLGDGWHRFVQDSPTYFRDAADYPLTGVGREVHNVELSRLAELGIVGAALWAATLLAGVIAPLRRRFTGEARLWQLALLAVAVDWLVVAQFVPLTQPFPHLVLWTFAGVAAAAGRQAAT